MNVAKVHRRRGVISLPNSDSPISPPAQINAQLHLQQLQVDRLCVTRLSSSPPLLLSKDGEI
jgi:hypothetical protein